MKKFCKIPCKSRLTCFFATRSSLEKAVEFVSHFRELKQWISLQIIATTLSLTLSGKIRDKFTWRDMYAKSRKTSQILIIKIVSFKFANPDSVGIIMFFLLINKPVFCLAIINVTHIMKGFPINIERPRFSRSLKFPIKS